MAGGSGMPIALPLIRPSGHYLTLIRLIGPYKRAVPYTGSVSYQISSCPIMGRKLSVLPYKPLGSLQPYKQLLPLIGGLPLFRHEVPIKAVQVWL